MKNLRKVLALVLVVATLCGFATVVGATDFSDAASVKNTEAVEVMNALGVINGYTDGSFKPGNNVTRAEMAKMVTAILNGGEDVGPLYSAANVFTDCGYHWARGYIAYATQVKLVAGIGGGKFNPDGNVTGTEAAKMLLCALGYEPEREGLVGTTWAAKTLSLARESGLTDGFAANFDFSKPLSRDNAALLMLNTLKAPMVKYTDDAGTIIVGGVEVITGGGRASKIGVKSSENTMKDNNEDLQLGEKSFGGDLALVTGTPDAFGRPSLKWTYNKKEIGTYNNTKPVLTYTAAVKGKDVRKDLGISDDSAEIQYIIEDGVTSNANSSAIIAKNNNSNVPGTGNGVTTEVYAVDWTVSGVDHDGYRIVIVNEYLGKVDKVTKANADKEINRSITVDAMTFETEDFAKGDYVLYTKASDDAGSTYSIKSAKAPEVVEDVAVTAYKSTDSVTAGGTKYSYSENPCSDSSFATNMTYNMDSGNTYTFYLDSCGNVIWAQKYDVANDNYVYVLESVASVVGTRGTDTVYYVDQTGKLNTATVSATASTSDAATAGKITANSSVNKWYTISDDSDHDGYKLFTLVDGDSSKSTHAVGNDGTGVSLNQNAGADKWILSKTQPQVANGIRADASTIFILQTDTDAFTTYTGIANLPSYEHTSDTKTSAVVVDNYAKVIFVNVSAMTSSSDADDLVYLFDHTSVTTESDGKNTYKVYDAIVDGVSTTVKVNNGTSISHSGLLKVTAYDGNGFIKSYSQITDGGNYVVKSFNGTTDEITYSEPSLMVINKTYLTDAETAVYMINADDDVTEATPDDLVGKPTSASNIYMVLDSGTITEIYFDGAFVD